MMNIKTLCVLSLLFITPPALAIDPGPASAQQQETEGWLLLQSRNHAASPTPQTQTATEREQALDRWLKKYKYEIPDFYDADAGGKVDSK